MENKKIKGHENLDLTDKQRLLKIKKGAKAFGKFLTILGYDWENDEHMKDTPFRFTKAWVNEIMVGNFSKPPKVTAFDETITGLKYNQIIVQKNIDIKSKCSHHLETIIGKAYIAYLPGESGMVVGLSKLNRIADYYSRRPQVQERLTVQIHRALNEAIPDNRGIAVYISSSHGCVSCRGIQHDSVMDTIEISGVFVSNPSAKDEFLFAINHKVS